MCGIAGAYGDVEGISIDEMLSTIVHRGPDEQGVLTDADIAMGTRRLSIIDLEGGSQPIFNENGSVAVCFNGEIYNHQSLRQDLERRGHQFTTKSDTEVLVHLWEEYQEQTPEYLNGMFAFSLWDRDRKEVFIARDRLGIKPLYYAVDDETTYWASELSVLRKTDLDLTIDQQAVYNYFTLRYSPGPRSFYSEVKKLPPGHWLRVGTADHSIQSYWNCPKQPVEIGTQEATTELRALLEKAVKRRLIADVPIGAFLSGGVDSSTIVGLMAESTTEEVSTFSVGFQAAEYDESTEAKYIADYFATDHHELSVDLDETDVFGRVVSTLGEPLADPALLPTRLLAEHARNDVKVVLTGEGADELFGGYWYYTQVPRHKMVARHLPSGTLATLSTAFRKSGIDEKYAQYAAALGGDDVDLALALARKLTRSPDEYLSLQGADNTEIRSKIEDSFDGIDDDDLHRRLSAFDIESSLPDNLLYKVDQATMGTSLEARVPFLDHELVEFGYRIPSTVKTHDGPKAILKRTVSDLLPDRTLAREKHGFRLPIERWFREDLDAINRWMIQDRFDRTPYLDGRSVGRLYCDHRRGTADHSQTLWKVLNYVAWYEEFGPS